METEEEERAADQFWLADIWVAEQGRLAGWLRAHGQVLIEDTITRAVTEFLFIHWKGFNRKELADTFRYARRIKEQEILRAQGA